MSARSLGAQCVVPGAAKTPSAPTAVSWAASLASRETTRQTVVSGDTGKDQHTQLCQGKKILRLTVLKH